MFRLGLQVRWPNGGGTPLRPSPIRSPFEGVTIDPGVLKQGESWLPPSPESVPWDGADIEDHGIVPQYPAECEVPNAMCPPPKRPSPIRSPFEGITIDPRALKQGESWLFPPRSPATGSSPEKFTPLRSFPITPDVAPSIQLGQDVSEKGWDQLQAEYRSEAKRLLMEIDKLKAIVTQYSDKLPKELRDHIRALDTLVRGQLQMIIENTDVSLVSPEKVNIMFAKIRDDVNDAWGAVKALGFETAQEVGSLVAPIAIFAGVFGVGLWALLG